MRLGFDYFRQAEDRYVPVTARGALKGLEHGILPPEAFLFLSTSVRPVDEEPVSLTEIDRILAREDLDLETNLLLMRVLRRLLASPDAEVALFAAESINRIEGRYINRIEGLKRQAAPRGDRESGDPQALGRLARAYYELAQIYPAAIRSFYLREAFACIKRLKALKALRRADVWLLVRVLLDLRLPGQALGVLGQLEADRDPQFLLLQAEVEFQRRNLPRVRELCLQLAAQEHRLDDKTRRVLDLWKEG
ncbi:MAG: hypothetical protein JW820_09950 [Spirochaetales bacterium]|nr:hypothetical protein [Spirochaetales bacterium]